MIEPYYQDDWATIYHGDCREILPQLDPVDLVLTDPPYGINYSHGRGGGKLARSTAQVIQEKKRLKQIKEITP